MKTLILAILICAPAFGAQCSSAGTNTLNNLAGTTCTQGSGGATITYSFPADTGVAGGIYVCTATGTGVCPTSAQVLGIQDTGGPNTILWEGKNTGCAKATPANCIWSINSGTGTVTVTITFSVQGAVIQGNQGHGFFQTGGGTVVVNTAVAYGFPQTLTCNSVSCPAPDDQGVPSSPWYLTGGFQAVTMTFTINSAGSSAGMYSNGTHFFPSSVDLYGGTYRLSCGANGMRTVSSAISSLADTSSASATVIVGSSANFNLYDSVYFTGTGTALDYSYPGGPGYVGLLNGNVLPTITNIAGTTLTVAVPTGTYSSSSGTLVKATSYTSKVSGRWFGCTPLGNAIFLNGVYQVDYASTAGGTKSFDNVINYNLVNGMYKVGPFGAGNQGCNWAYRTALRLKGWGFNYLDAQPSTFLAPWQTNACYGGDSSIPSNARMLGVIQPQVSLYASNNKFQGNSATLQMAPGLVAGVINLVKFSVVGSGLFVKGFDDVADANFPQYIASNVLTSGTRANTALVNPHHEWVGAINGDESDEMGGQNIANTPAQSANEGTCGTSAYWCQAKYSSTIGSGTVAYLDPISGGQQDLYYPALFLAGSPTLTGIIRNSNAVGGSKGTDTNDHVLVNSVPGLSGTFAAGTVTLTGVLGASIFNGQSVWVTASSAADWIGGPFTATGTQTGYATGTVTFSCGGCSTASASGVTIQANNFTVALKADLVSWLQGTADQQTGVSLTRTGGSTVVATFGSQQPFTTHDVLTVSSCSSFNTAAGTPVKVTAFTSTDPALRAPGGTNTVTFTQSGSNVTTGSCVVGAGPGYALGTLNTAWNSNYDTLGSDATNHTTTLTTSDNLTWTGTLTGPVIPSSVYVTSGTNNVTIAGDDGSGPKKASATNNGNFRSGVNNSDTGLTSTKSANCTSSPSNAICYDTGAVTLTFQGSQSNVKATYQTGGWGSGKGLLDEDGSCPAKSGSTCWMPNGATTGYYFLSGGTAAGITYSPTANFITDMNNYYFRLMKLYCRNITTPYHAALPGVIVTNFATNGPTWPWTYWAIGQYFDIEAPTFPLPDPTSTGGQGSTVTDNQARIDFLAANLGDLPWGWQEELTSWNDDYYQTQPTQPPNAGALDFDTQVHKGAYYKTHTSALLNAKIGPGCATFLVPCSLSGTYPVVNRSWYGYVPDTLTSPAGTAGAWGLITIREDALDGVQATKTPGTEVVTYNNTGYSYATGCQNANSLPGTPVLFPCEPSNLGDFLDSVMVGNAQWLGVLNPMVVGGFVLKGAYTVAP